MDSDLQDMSRDELLAEVMRLRQGIRAHRDGTGQQAPRAPRTGEAFGGVDGAEETVRRPVVLLPGEGRAYAMGGMSAIFKADEAETAGRYSISEWWLAPDTQGPGTHSHPEDDAFHVLEGTMSFQVGGEWIDCPRGSFVLVPGGTTHDFQNRGSVRAGMLNISAPGGFEADMGMIVEWFEKHPPGRASG